MPDMRSMGKLFFAAGLCLYAAAHADTIYLTSGVCIEGKVSSQTDKAVKINIGNRTVAVQASEVARIEQNELTGVIDRDKVRAEAEAREAQLLSETGLNGQQRAQVTALLAELISSDSAVRSRATEKFMQLAQEADLIRYFEWCSAALLPRYVPGVLELAAQIDPTRAKNLVRRHATDPDAASRAKAMELIGRLGDKSSTDLLARGLIDHQPEVQAAAANSTAVLGAVELAPVLIAVFDAPDLRVCNACTGALRTIWPAAGELQKKADWAAYSQAHPLGGGIAYDPAHLEPLVPAGVEFRDE